MSDASLWDRLNESIERLGAVSGRKGDAAAVTARLAGRARVLRGRMTSAAGPQIMLLAYSKGRQRFAIPLEYVLEVQALESVSPVPRTPAFVIGVIHWRGTVLTLVDMGRLLGAAETGLADVHVCIVVEAAGRRLALAALEVEDIMAAPASPAAAVAELSSQIPPEWTLGIRDDNRIILNIDAIMRDPKLSMVQ